MKKIELMVLITLISLSTAFAQKIAVLDFKAGVGINQSDVDGISAVFTTYFSPRGYTIVERNQVDKVLREQGLQGTNLTESDMVQLGKILNVNKIVVGDVNIVAGQYNVDVRVVDVQAAYVTGKDGATFPKGSSYRETMKKLAERLAVQIAVVTGQTGTFAPSIGKSKSGSVETILGYLHVYPEDIGIFNSNPTSVIKAVNDQGLHGYGDWRLPTDEELSLMMTQKEALGISNIDNYMSTNNASSGMKRLVRLVTTGKTIIQLREEKRQQEEEAAVRRKKEEEQRAEAQKIAKQRELEEIKRTYVDLGLPSGTLWKKYTEGTGNVDDRTNSGYYSYQEGITKFGKSIPTRDQWEELYQYCTWSSKGYDGYTITGKNGNSIYIEKVRYWDGGGASYSHGEAYPLLFFTSTRADEDPRAYYMVEVEIPRKMTFYASTSKYKYRVRLVYNP